MSQAKFFADKTILITGGTGSIGSEVLKSLVKTDAKSIIVFSRDEYKQYKLKYTYPNVKKIKYVLGDVRSYNSLNDICGGVDMIFHCAALKHVPISEEMPEEFIKTNILGSVNVKRTAINNNIPIVVSISSDKAVNPSNLMGLTKAVQEKVFASDNIYDSKSRTKFVNVRFGNVVGTNGSLFPILHQQIQNKIPLTITDERMSRFFMTPEESVKLIFWAAQNGNNGDIVIKKMRSIYIIEVMKEMILQLKRPANYPIQNTGIRVGEKLDESLVSEDELYRLVEKNGYYIIKAYPDKSLSKNVMPQQKPTHKLSAFLSNTSDNIMSQAELKKLVAYYIKNHFKKNKWI